MMECIEELRVYISKGHWTDNRTCNRIPCIFEEWARLDGSRHRPHGLPATVVRHAETAAVIREEYFEHGVHHRWEKPAIVHHGIEDERMEWHVRGQSHRDSAPAVVEFHRASGVVTEEAWYFQGKLFRPGGGLARFCRVFDTDIDMVTEEKWLDAEGRLHREEGPAELLRDTTYGEVITERWVVHGEPHRDPSEGAATIYRDIKGEVEEAHYFDHGRAVGAPQLLIEPGF